MNDAQQPLEVHIKTTGNEAISVLQKLLIVINKVKVGINSDVTSVKKWETEIKKLRIETSRTAEEMDELRRSFRGAYSSMRMGFGGILNIGMLYLALNLTKRLRDTIFNLFENTASYEKTMQRFTGSFGGLSDEADSFQQKLIETYGLAEIETKQAQTVFNNLIKSLGGTTDEMAMHVSELLTMVSIDYASAYALTVEAASNKIKSGIIGETEAVRKEAGFDITEDTIGLKAHELGITKNITALSQMEKRLLRVLVLSDQMNRTGAMNNFEKTIYSISNQLTIMKSQIKEIGIWIGNYLVANFGYVMVVINGVLMALKEIIKTMATLAGYKVTGNLSSGVDADTDAVDNLNSSLEKTKQLTTGLDELNILNDSAESASADTTMASTVDPAIQEAINNLKSGFEEIDNASVRIRDAILEWFGNTPEERVEKFKKILEKIKNIAILIAGIFAIKWMASILMFIASFIILINKAWLLIAANGVMILEFLVIIAALALWIWAWHTIATSSDTEDIINSLMQIGGLVFAIAAGIFGLPLLIAGVVAAVIVAIISIAKYWDELVYTFRSDYENLGTDIEQIWIDLWRTIAQLADKGWMNFYYGGWQISEMLSYNIKAAFLLVLKTISDKINGIIDMVAGLAWIFGEDAVASVKGSKITIVDDLIAANDKAYEDKLVEIGNAYAKELEDKNLKYEQERLADDVKKKQKARANILSQGRLAGEYLAKNEVKGEEKEKENEEFDILAEIKKILEESGIKDKDAKSTKEQIKDGSIADNIKEVLNEIGLTGEKTDIQTSLLESMSDVLNKDMLSIDKESLEVIEEQLKQAQEIVSKGETNSSTLINEIKNATNSIVTAVNNIRINVSYATSSSNAQKYTAIKRFASGGLPNMGELFVAREAGAELVGSVGGRTGVMNNTDIVSAVSQGVASAVASTLGGKKQTVIQIDGKAVLNAVEKAQSDRGINIMGGAFANA